MQEYFSTSCVIFRKIMLFKVVFTSKEVKVQFPYQAWVSLRTFLTNFLTLTNTYTHSSLCSNGYYSNLVKFKGNEYHAREKHGPVSGISGTHLLGQHKAWGQDSLLLLLLLFGCSGFCSVLFYNNHGLGVAVASNTLGGDRGPSYCNS